jgi:stage V sporulation protein SpoVS
LGNTEIISAATNPIIVSGAIAGATTAFTGIEVKEICPESATITGVHKVVAAIGIANGSAKNFGSFNCKNLEIGWFRKMIPEVAKTESANPASTP